MFTIWKVAGNYAVEWVGVYFQCRCPRKLTDSTLGFRLGCAETLENYFAEYY